MGIDLSATELERAVSEPWPETLPLCSYCEDGIESGSVTALNARTGVSAPVNGRFSKRVCNACGYRVAGRIIELTGVPTPHVWIYVPD